MCCIVVHIIFKQFLYDIKYMIIIQNIVYLLMDIFPELLIVKHLFTCHLQYA